MIEVLPEVHSEYIQFHEIGSSLPYSFEDMSKVSKLLFDPNQTEKQKRQMLFRLAHTGLAEAFLLLNDFLQESKGLLQQWCAVCLDECQVFVQADMDESDDPTKIQSMISSSLGGDGQKRLHCYIALSTTKSNSLSENQKKQIEMMANQVAK